MSVEEKYKQKIIALISALIPQAKIYLFGSRARKTHILGSDVDIALDTGIRLNIADVGEVRDVLNATNIPHKIDVVDIHNVSKDMQNLIQKEKTVWKQ